MATAKQILGLLERSAEQARKKHPHDESRRLDTFVTSLSGALSSECIGQKALGDTLFALFQNDAALVASTAIDADAPGA